MVKNLPAVQETWVRSLVRKIPWRRAWQPTPAFLPGKSHGQRNLAGYTQSMGSQRVRHDWATVTFTVHTDELKNTAGFNLLKFYLRSVRICSQVKLAGGLTLCYPCPVLVSRLCWLCKISRGASHLLYPAWQATWSPNKMLAAPPHGRAVTPSASVSGLPLWRALASERGHVTGAARAGHCLLLPQPSSLPQDPQGPTRNCSNSLAPGVKIRRPEHSQT